MDIAKIIKSEEEKIDKEINLLKSTILHLEQKKKNIKNKLAILYIIGDKATHYSPRENNYLNCVCHSCNAIDNDNMYQYKNKNLCFDCLVKHFLADSRGV